MERLRTFTNHVLYEEELIRWRQALIKYLPPEWGTACSRTSLTNGKRRDFRRCVIKELQPRVDYQLMDMEEIRKLSVRYENKDYTVIYGILDEENWFC